MLSLVSAAVEGLLLHWQVVNLSDRLIVRLLISGMYWNLRCGSATRLLLLFYLFMFRMTIFVLCCQYEVYIIIIFILRSSLQCERCKPTTQNLVAYLACCSKLLAGIYSIH